MDQSVAKLSILLDLIGKKVGLLSQILTICENQEAILVAERSEEYDKLFIGMGREKQLLVDEVITTDELFQKIFNEIGEDFEAVGESNTEVIRKLQERIMGVTELDAKIRLAENRNLERLAQARTTYPKQGITEVSKQQLLEKYKSNDKKPKDKRRRK